MFCSTDFLRVTQLEKVKIEKYIIYIYIYNILIYFSLAGSVAFQTCLF